MNYCLFILILIALLSAKHVLYAQDYHLSTYYHSPLNLSPSETGNFDGSIRLSGIQRNQWRSISRPYQTLGAGVDAAEIFGVKHFGAGLQLISDFAGDGNFHELHLQLPIAKGFDFKSKKQHLRIGITPSLLQSSIDFDRLFFDNQFVGSAFDPNAASGENFANNNFFRFNLAAGISYALRWKDRNQLFTQIGFFNVFQPNQEFINQRGEISLRTSWAAGLNLSLLPFLDIQPQLQFQQQGNFDVFIAGANVNYILKDKAHDYFAFIGGVHFRNKDALIPSIGGQFTRLSVMASYDLHIAALQNETGRRGGFEISLIYIFDKKPPQRLFFHQCPTFI